MSEKVRKVVIPVAGMGTRFLPATKVLPKELLPIVDRPIIQLIVEECVSAGMETIVFVTSRPKVTLEDHFDPADLASWKLAAAGKAHLIESVLELAKKIQIISIRQHVPRGLGDAVLTSEAVIGNSPFAVVLGDDIVINNGGPSAIGQCLKKFDENDKASVIGVLEVPQEETSKYGIVGFENEKTGKVASFVEKPSPEKAPSNWALPGRYVFQPSIFDAIRATSKGVGNEIQLTDAMAHLLKSESFFAEKIQGTRFDTGDKLGYIMANVHFALQDEKYKETLGNWLKKTVAEL
ncbi:MAG: UTP--glucose-1-phosphate uridylyltransferase [Bdellovibrionota bacterium]